MRRRDRLKLEKKLLVGLKRENKIIIIAMLTMKIAKCKVI